ncbi:MAG: hypothetical protein ISP49_04580 [Reyranella sp.]|jgi:hypothetical protein|nr:hypothetical protein [Reyranella sp.]MBL6650844.1 hypothetical protein [Reyranella sp.]
MGFLLKIILFGVAVYAAWKTFHRWKGMWDKFVGNDQPARSAPPPPPAQPVATRRTAAIQDTVQCAGCGAYIPAEAEKCGQCGRPQSPGRRG